MLIRDRELKVGSRSSNLDVCDRGSAGRLTLLFIEENLRVQRAAHRRHEFPSDEAKSAKPRLEKTSAEFAELQRCVI